MNSLADREWEIYNYDQLGASTEYDNILINKDIDNYFNDLISKPVPIQNNLSVKSSYNFEKFYSDYVEHNLLFIVLLIGIIIFLIIRYNIKDFDTFNSTSDDLNDDQKKSNNIKDDKINITNSGINLNTDSESDTDNSQNQKKYLKHKNKLKKINGINQIKRKHQIEKIKLMNYKKQLDLEKEKILNIIDELSNINDYENTKSRPYPSYLGQDINTGYGTNYINTQRFFNQAIEELPRLPHNLNENSHYYDINKNTEDDSNKIDGLYIEPPFN
jgi:hypothetical protein